MVSRETDEWTAVGERIGGRRWEMEEQEDRRRKLAARRCEGVESRLEGWSLADGEMLGVMEVDASFGGLQLADGH